MIKWCWLGFAYILTFSSCSEKSIIPPKQSLQLIELRLGTYVLNLTDPTQNLSSPTNQPIEGKFPPHWMKLP